MKRESIAKIAYEILKEEEKPLHYKELTELLLKRLPLEGKTPYESVRTQIGYNQNFKRIAEGVYALAEWEGFSTARFAKDIAYDILQVSGKPMTLTELGEAILKERALVGKPRMIARNVVRNDQLKGERFYYDSATDLVSLSGWKKEASGK
jgi:hypothetical protein